MKRRVHFVSVIVLASALASGCSARRDPEVAIREAVLKQDLFMMRSAIDKYTLDKQQAPQSLQDLVKGHYLKEIPTDPFTRKRDWVPQFNDVVLNQDQSSTGVVDVHSASNQVDRNGIPYNEW